MYSVPRALKTNKLNVCSTDSKPASMWTNTIPLTHYTGKVAGHHNSYVEVMTDLMQKTSNSPMLRSDPSPNRLFTKTSQHGFHAVNAVIEHIAEGLQLPVVQAATSVESTIRV
jgi:hypothetical protein